MKNVTSVMPDLSKDQFDKLCAEAAFYLAITVTAMEEGKRTKAMHAGFAVYGIQRAARVLMNDDQYAVFEKFLSSRQALRQELPSADC